MCGIFGIMCDDVFNLLINGLKILKNRGYDGCGIAMIHKNNFIIHKCVNIGNNKGIEKLEKIKNDDTYKIGISHTRWSTHGIINKVNTHPHVCYRNKLALVHNGIIENYYEIKQKLIKNGVTFISQTDTEVIVNLISYNMNIYNDLNKSLQKSFLELRGTWGLLLLHCDEPNSIYLAKNGSPILISLNDNIAMISSEQSGFQGLTNNYTCLNDGDISVIKKENNKMKLETLYSNKPLRNIVSYKLNKTNMISSPSPYAHWTIKEILEQDESMKRAINMGGRIKNDEQVRLGGLTRYKDKLLKIENLIILGCGTSFNAGLIGKKYFMDMRIFNTIQVIDGAEFTIDDIPLKGKTGLLLLSQSGETKDLHKCIKIGRDNNMIIISVINVVGSVIAREVDCGIYLNAGREVAVASTKCFTSQIVVLAMMSIWFAQNKNLYKQKRIQYIQHLRNLSIDIKKTFKTREQCKKIADLIYKKNNCFLLGKGGNQAIGKEGALKIKEISYIHAQAYSASSLKHGTFALLEENTPVLYISSDDKWWYKINNTAEEVKSRKGLNILITDKDTKGETYNHIIKVPNNNTFFGLLSVIPLQFIAYELSINKGINPDFPKNLAKCVTTE